MTKASDNVIKQKRVVWQQLLWTADACPKAFVLQFVGKNEKQLLW